MSGLGRRRVGAAVLHPVHDRATSFLHPVLEPADHGLDAAEPCVDGLPAGGDELDEQLEIVDASLSLDEQIRLEPLKPADRLVHQPPNLREVPRDRLRVAAHGFLELGRQPLFEHARRRGERLDLLPRPHQ